MALPSLSSVMMKLVQIQAPKAKLSVCGVEFCFAVLGLDSYCP